MIKVIVYDLVGVLVTEKDIELSSEEAKLERMFGPNLNDLDYLMMARKVISNDSVIIKTTEDLIAKLYQVKNKNLFKEIKEKYPNIKQIIATNHVSFIKNFINKYLDSKYLDDIIISSEVHKIKPHKNFYNLILNKYNLKPEELLFIDDNKNNIESASKLGIKTILVYKNMDLGKEILKVLYSRKWYNKNKVITLKEVIHNYDNLKEEDVTETVVRMKSLIINSNIIYIGNEKGIWQFPGGWRNF